MKCKTCRTCRFRRREVYPTMDGAIDGCSLFSMYMEDEEHAGITDDNGNIMYTKYIDKPEIFGTEDAGMMLPNPDRFGCMLHEEA